MDCREVAHKLGEFTIPEMAEALGTTRSPARERIMWMVSLGIVENTGRIKQGKRGRPATVYRYVPIPVIQTARRRETPPELEVVKKVRRAGTVPGTSSTVRTSSKKKNALLRKARRQGFKVRKVRSGHVEVISPDGKRFTTAATPTREGVAEDEKKLRKLGLVA